MKENPEKIFIRKPPCQEERKVLYSPYISTKVIEGGTLMQITKNTLIGELLQLDVDTAQLLMGAGMHCIG